MKIQVFVQPGAKRDRVEKQEDLLGNEIYNVRTRAKPIDGEANEALVSLIAEYFGLKKYQVKLLRGELSRHKTIAISQ